MPKYRKRSINIGRMPIIVTLPFMLAMAWISSILLGFIIGIILIFSTNFFISFGFFFIALFSFFGYFYLAKKYGEFVFYRMNKKQIRFLKSGNLKF